jgi:hypothetical protein
VKAKTFIARALNAADAVAAQRAVADLAADGWDVVAVVAGAARPDRGKLFLSG